MNKPCSIYEVSGKGFTNPGSSLSGEYRINKKVRILKEEKYKSAKDCMIKNNVKIKVI